MYRSSRGGTKAALVSALVIAASAGAFFLSTGLGVVWPLAWLAPLPVLLLAFRRSWRVSALVAFLAYFLGSFTILGLFRAGGLIIFAGPPAMAFAVAVLLARSAVGRVGCMPSDTRTSSSQWTEMADVSTSA
jgi:apolipoprotein N-acyltransferase